MFHTIVPTYSLQSYNKKGIAPIKELALMDYSIAGVLLAALSTRKCYFQLNLFGCFSKLTMHKLVSCDLIKPLKSQQVLRCQDVKARISGFRQTGANKLDSDPGRFCDHLVTTVSKSTSRFAQFLCPVLQRRDELQRKKRKKTSFFVIGFSVFCLFLLLS